MKAARLLLLANTIAALESTSQQHTASSAFDWSSLESLPSLQYHDCYEEFQCARLRVPLDWNHADDERYASIAVIRLPAVVSQTDPRYGGAIITNPGGPGGSGVADVLAHGHHLQEIVDGERHYDVVSFDPRGIYHSRPAAKCFDNDAARRVFSFQQREVGLLDEDFSVIKRRRALAEAFGAVCELAETSHGSDQYLALSSMSTAMVARDMLEIVDQIEEHRNQMLPARTAVVRPKGKLQYYGFSYGTQLGNTFASMYPDRVKAMVLDGVVDSNDFSNGMWLTSLLDTEVAVEHFYTSCYDAGNKCSLRSANDTSGHDIQKRVEDFLSAIAEAPETWVQNGFAEVITVQAVKDLFLLPLYMPIPLYELLASSLSAMLKGNYTPIVHDLERDAPLSAGVCRSPQSDFGWDFEAAVTYICNDGRDLSGMSNTEVQEYVDQLKVQSPTFGAYWAWFGVTCAGWKIRPTRRFAGPYGRHVLPHLPPSHADATRPQQQQALQEVHDDRPVLFLSSKVDPVTPLRNAYAMSALHPGSAVVVQESFGHCATYSAPSKCTKRIVEAYFAGGDMPKNGTVCTIDCEPWDQSEHCRAFDRLSLQRIAYTGQHLRQWPLLAM